MGGYFDFFNLYIQQHEHNLAEVIPPVAWNNTCIIPKNIISRVNQLMGIVVNQFT